MNLNNLDIYDDDEEDEGEGHEDFINDELHESPDPIPPSSLPPSALVDDAAPLYSFPFSSLSIRRGVNQRLTGRKLSKEAFQALLCACQAFWVYAAEDLLAYARHAQRHRVVRQDVELLIRRQRLLSLVQQPSLDALIRARLGYELRGMLIPIARAYNEVDLKRAAPSQRHALSALSTDAPPFQIGTHHNEVTLCDDVGDDVVDDDEIH